ncbi:MAG: hypothetical protein ACERKO_02360 [Acetanaerobacterium sp.]
MPVDKQLFQDACARVIGTARTGGGGIGTLGEKTLHAVLKHYLSPDCTTHEIAVGGFVCDIVTPDGITEIQTRGFDKLRRKLSCLLDTSTVTVVYPVACTKWLFWIDEETGEVTKRRKSPKAGTPYEVFFELYRIKELLCHPNLRLCILLLDVEEYRRLNGWSRDKKRGSTRCERIPVALVQEVRIDTPEQYARLLPEKLDTVFTSKEYAKASRLSMRGAQRALNVLFSVGAVTRTGKRGNLLLYERAHPEQAVQLSSANIDKENIIIEYQ